jgi:hypothetical protein
MSQMTPAAINTIRRGRKSTEVGGNGGARRRRRKSNGTAKKARRSGGKRKLKFGSPAWRKKYMKK